MIQDKIDIIFSDLATQKISKLPHISQIKLNQFFDLDKKSIADLNYDKKVNRLSNNFFTFQIDNNSKVFFTIEGDKIFVTDIINNYREGHSILPDPEILEYLQKHDPSAIDKILDISVRQHNHRMKMEEDIFLREKQNEKLWILIATFFALVGITFSGYLLIFAKQTIISVILLSTILLPIISTFLTKKRIKK